MASLKAEVQLRASALHLRFGDMFDRVARELAAPQVHGARFEYLPLLPEDVLLRVLGFLDLALLTRTGSACRSLHLFCKQHETSLWAPHIKALAMPLGLTLSPPCSDSPSSNASAVTNNSSGCIEPVVPELSNILAGWHGKRRCLQLLLLRYTAEARHFRTLKRLMSALTAMPAGSVVNVVGNVGWFEDAAVALAVCKQRHYSMPAVILVRSEDAVIFRRKTDYVGPLTFFAQDNITGLLEWTNLNEDCFPAINARGFRGYVVELIKLHKDDEYMRFTFLLSAYRNLTVWDSEEDARLARLNNQMPSWVPHVVADTSPKRIHRWLQFGTVSNSGPDQDIVNVPLFVSIGKPRPRFNALSTPELLGAHCKALEDKVMQLDGCLRSFDKDPWPCKPTASIA